MQQNRGRLPVMKMRLKELQGDMSATDFAKKIGLSRQTVGFYLNGDRIPDSETLIQICRSCNVSADWLLGLTDVKNPALEMQAMCSYTGLCEEAISNLHTESKDAEAISGLNSLLSSDFDTLHRLDWLIYKALSLYSSHPADGHIIVPLGRFIPKDKQKEVFSYLDAWGGELLDPIKAKDYYVSQAAHRFQSIIEAEGERLALSTKTLTEQESTAGDTT